VALISPCSVASNESVRRRRRRRRGGGGGGGGMLRICSLVPLRIQWR